MTTEPDSGPRYVAGVVLDAEDARTLHDALSLFVGLLRSQGSRPTAKLDVIRRQLATAVSVSETVADTSAHVRKSANTVQVAASSAHEHYIGTDVAASLLGCSTANVRDLARRGTLPARSVAGRWLVDAPAVRARAARR